MSGRIWWVASLVVVAVVAAGIVVATRETDKGVAGSILVADTKGPVALVALPDGGLLYGERTSGVIHFVDGEGRLQLDPVGRVSVSSADGGGLLDLAVDIGERTFASYTGPDRHVEVARVAGNSAHVIWRGPVTGAAPIDFAPNGDLVTGLWERGGEEGSIVAIDPNGKPDQEPRVVSPGWRFPLGLTYDDTGRLWVAENGENDNADHLGLATPEGPARVGDLPAGTNPSGIAPARDGSLAVCSPSTNELRLHDAMSGGAPEPAGRLLATDCAYGVVALPDGRLAYATETAIKTVRP